MMREKRRYILVESTFETAEGLRKEFEFELFKELMHNLGEINYFKANPKVMKYIGAKKFILKCNLVKYKDVVLALTFIKRIAGKEAAFYTLNASGTIKALEKEKISFKKS
jgi:RNase P/RNase MRP subunit POP5